MRSRYCCSACFFLFCAMVFLLRDEVPPVIAREAPGISVGLRRRRREHREGNLGDLHPGAKHDWDIALVRYLKGDMEKVPRVDDPCRVVDHEADSRERRFAVQLYQKIIRTEILFRGSEDRNAGVENIGRTVLDRKFARLRKYLFHRVNAFGRSLIINDKFVAEANIITNLLELIVFKRLEDDALCLYLPPDVSIREKHGEPLYLLLLPVRKAPAHLELHRKRAQVGEAEGELSFIARVSLCREKKETGPKEATSRIHHRHEVKGRVDGFSCLHEVVLAGGDDKIILYVAFFELAYLFSFHSFTLPEACRAISLYVSTTLDNLMNAPKTQIDTGTLGVREIAAVKAGDQLLFFNPPHHLFDTDDRHVLLVYSPCQKAIPLTREGSHITERRASASSLRLGETTKITA